MGGVWNSLPLQMVHRKMLPDIQTWQGINNANFSDKLHCSEGSPSTKLNASSHTRGLIHPKPKITTQSPNTVLTVASWHRLHLASLSLQPVSVWCAKATTARHADLASPCLFSPLWLVSPLALSAVCWSVCLYSAGLLQSEALARAAPNPTTGFTPPAQCNHTANSQADGRKAIRDGRFLCN